MRPTNFHRAAFSHSLGRSETVGGTHDPRLQTVSKHKRSAVPPVGTSGLVTLDLGVCLETRLTERQVKRVQYSRVHVAPCTGLKHIYVQSVKLSATFSPSEMI